uniref:OsmC family protein n=1 Tax=Ningiella ruwaisensis TaxID=2364274 RepID=UPI0010A082C6|nr:OsmC family protein [Ningiella ruwaisensis]
MGMKSSATAKYKGLGKEGKGFVSTESGAFDNQPYGFNTRFEDEAGTNPEEQIAAAHASCFAMALSFELSKKGLDEGEIDTKSVVTLVEDGEGFKVESSALTLNAKIKGIEESDFKEVAEGAKANCPISKVLNCDISLNIESFKRI